jgi:hypothetical protein
MIRVRKILALGQRREWNVWEESVKMVALGQESLKSSGISSYSKGLLSQ